MSKYLVECTCGNKLPVDLGQAGGQITCSCGNLVDVPTLRKLRHLPTAEAEVARPTTTWNARKGVITASLLLAGAITSINAWSWLTQPKVPAFDPAVYEHSIEEYLKTTTPTLSWQRWIDHYKPMAEQGFGNLELVDRFRLETIIAERTSLRRTLWIVVAFAAIVAAAAAFWPKPQEVTSRRSG